MPFHHARYSAWTDLDLDRPGKSVGSIFIPMSTDRSAYRALRIPLVMINAGNGPGCLITSGSHGDEYEGQIVASRLAREIEPDDVAGSVFILPNANLPACLAGTRLSPLDQGNLNLAFPGETGGEPTTQLAAFIEAQLLPRQSLWIDLHSGGRSLRYRPMPAVHLSSDAALNRRTIEALQAFGATDNLIFVVQESRSASVAAQRQDVVYLYGEFGGGGPICTPGVRIAYDGAVAVLRFIGCLSGGASSDSGRRQRFLIVSGDDFRDTRRLYAFARSPGIFEPRLQLGDMVKAGDVIGWVQPIGSPMHDPEVVSAETDGVLVCLRGDPLVENGDCLAHLAREIQLDRLAGTAL